MPDYLTVCEDAVRQAGATLRDWMGKTSVRYKGRADLVTEADVASQELIRKIVLGAFPDHSLLGEEDAPASVGGGRNSAGSPIRWTARRIMSTACRTSPSRWRWNATAALWWGPSTTPIWTSALRRLSVRAPF